MDLIAFCYGADVNIYEVLEVDQDASQKDIQSAFVTRRLELYQRIQSIEKDEEAQYIVEVKDEKNLKLTEKEFVEKKMDALIGAFRILRDPRKRQKYDTMLSSPSKKANDLLSSPKSLLDYNDSSMTDDLNEITAATNNNHNLPPKKEETKILKPKRTSKTTSSSKVKSSRTSKVSKKGSAALPSKSQRTPSSASNQVKENGKELGRLEKSTIKLEKTGQLKEEKAGQLKEEKAGQLIIEDRLVEDYYKDIVICKETSLGSWLRRNEMKDQADAVDTFSHELFGSAADIWLSMSQVASAFTVEEEVIGALTETIQYAAEDATTELSTVRLV